MSRRLALRRHTVALGLVLVLSVAPVVSGCSQGASGASAGDVKVAATAMAGLPPFLDDSPATVREAYEYARANPTVLKQVPCYCGCQTAGHRNVFDCFVKELRSDGTVVWDKMAYG